MNNEQLESYLNERYPNALTNLRVVKDILIADAQAGSLRDIVRTLRDDAELQLDYLRCLSGVDPGEGKLRVAYHFISMEKLHQLCLHVNVSRESPKIQSLVPLWGTANWQEREIYDLFGIDFEGHPDLRRILLPNEWEGHPLRKDYQFHAEGRGEFVETQVEVGLLPNPNEPAREQKQRE